QIDYGNGVQAIYRYDKRQRLASLLTHHASRITEPLIHFSYGFDAVSNIKAIDDQRPESVVAAGDHRRNTQTFTYDDLYRLTRAQYSFAAPDGSPSPLRGERAGVRGAAIANGGQINYRYDRIGNMLAQTSDI